MASASPEKSSRSNEIASGSSPEDLQSSRTDFCESVVEDILEEDMPVSVSLLNVIRFKDRPDYKELLERAVRIELEKGTVLRVLANFDYFKNEPYAEKILTSIAKDNPGELFLFFDTIDGAPYAKKIFSIAADANTFAAFLCMADHKNHPFAKDILLQIVSGGVPENIILFLDKFRDCPYYDEVFNRGMGRMVEVSPHFALKFNYFYKGKPAYEELLKKAAENCSLDYPEEALYRHYVYYGEPYYDEVVETALASCITTTPKNFLSYINLFKDKSYAKKSFLLFAEKAYSYAIFWHQSYSDLPFHDEILIKALGVAAEKNPSAVTLFVKNSRSEPFYQKLYPSIYPILRASLSKAAKSQPNAVLEYFKEESANKSFEDFKLIYEAIVNAADSPPEDFIEFCHKYEWIFHLPLVASKAVDFDSLLERALFKMLEKNTSSNGCVRHFSSYYLDKPFAEKFFLSASDKAPFSVLIYFSNFKMQPYADRILKNIVRYHPNEITDMKNRAESGNYDAERIKALPDWALKEAVETEQKFSRYKDLSREIVSVETNHSLAEESVITALRDFKLTIPRDEFLHIFFSGSFQKYLDNQAGKVSYFNAFSTVHAVHRNLTRKNLSFSEDNFDRELNLITDAFNKVKDREIFGPNTKLILFTHEQEDMGKEAEELKKMFLKAGGRKSDVLFFGKGLEMRQGKNIVKTKTLDSIKNSNGPTTILFNGHGSPENWAFSENFSDDLNRSDSPDPSTINYKELGDALIASGNIDQFNLIGDTCYAYDYIHNLYKYLDERGVRKRPAISISVANKNSIVSTFGGLSLFEIGVFIATSRAASKGKSLTVGDLHFYEDMLGFEDPGFIVGDDYIGYNTDERFLEVAKGGRDSGSDVSIAA